MRKRAALVLFLSALVPGAAWAVTLADVQLAPESLAPYCSPVEGEHPVSIQAATFYAVGSTLVNGIVPASKEKAFQSFSCAGEKSTLYYYIYASPQDLEKAQTFARPYIWGEEGRTSMHPEIIFPYENALIVISSRHGDYFLYDFLYGIPGDVGQDAMDSVDKSVEAYKKKDYKEAEKGFTAFSKNKPDLVLGHLYLGNSLYYQQKYHEAIPAYERVLALAAKGAALGRYNDKVATDNLGIAYALDGQMDKAKALFEAAIKKDPDYPMYYYNLACAQAELGQLDNALVNLKAGFARKGKMLPGEEYPDPRTDDSFKKYTSEPKFQAAMKEMGL